MPRLVHQLPKLRRNARGQAVVTIDGKQYYCGRHGTPEAQSKFHAVLCATGLLAELAGETPSVLTVGQLSKSYQAGDGRHTNNPHALESALRHVRHLYGDLAAAEFGPKRLKGIREQMVAEGWSRGYVNEQVRRVVRMFQWAVSEELVTETVWRALTSVEPLRRGKCDAPEGRKVKPVPAEIINKTLKHLGPVVADMVRVQWLCGGRPQDVYNLRPCDVVQEGEVWLCQPAKHKNDWRDKDRVLYLGPRTQKILKAYLAREPESHCFSPAEAERLRRVKLTAERKTPAGYGNRPGTNRKAEPKRTAGEKYNKDSYARAIRRAAKNAGVSHWSPNQLRHAKATEVRAKYGLAGASAYLGHSDMEITQTYAERDVAAGKRIALEVG